MSPKKTSPEAPVEELKKTTPLMPKWTIVLSWVGTLLLVVVMIAVLFKFNPLKLIQPEVQPVGTPVSSDVPLPSYHPGGGEFALVRVADIDTSISAGYRQFPVMYTIEEGDSIFAIAKKFDLEPESILWANFDLLKDDPTFLAIGWKLTIPPTNGIYYKWKEGDSLEKLAEKYNAAVIDIMSWPSNKLDITAPTTNGLEYVMIPGGSREILPWIVPLPFAPRSGATRVIAGPGGCQAPGTGPVGSTGFIWPTYNNFLSGFDFTSYHLGIDIAAAEGTPVYASDSGTVIYAGWNDTGYGYMIEIDHNNGYQTLYAHLSALYIRCGSSVFQGTTIAAAGSTGKSTGSHLHFEVRLNGGFVNPWSILGQ